MFGGAAGGGKTVGLLLDPIKYVHIGAFKAVIFRRESIQITSAGGLFDSSIALYPDLGGKPRITPARSWQFSSGAEIIFGHLNAETDVLGWQGSEICGLYFDELSHFHETQFLYMMSRNRSTSGIPPYIRATTNPDADSWITDWIGWWIDQDTGYPIPQRSGVMRWFVREDAVIHWGNSKQELLDQHPGSMPRSFTFIAATLADNPALTSVDPGYRANLLSMNRVERERLLFGNWKIRADRGSYFPRGKLAVVSKVPTGLRLVRGWDLAATEPSELNPSPDRTASVLLGCDSHKRFYVLDAFAVTRNAWAVRALLKATAEADKARWGHAVSHRLNQDPGQAGKAQMSELAGHLAGYSFRFERETGPKETRAQALSAQWQAGNCAAVDGPWLKAFLAEMEAFPSSGVHDDQVDSAVSAFTELTTRVSNMARWLALAT